MAKEIKIETVEKKKYKLKIRMLTGETYQSKEYDGDVLLGTTLIDFVNDHIYYSGNIVFTNNFLLGYDIPATMKLKDLKIDLENLLTVSAILGPLHGKKRFGLLENVIAFFNSGLLWPPFDPKNNEDPISLETLGAIDMKNITNLKTFWKEKNGINNTNAPNLMIIELPDSKGSYIRQTVHKLTYLKSITTCNGKCPLTKINISKNCFNIILENIKEPLPVINITTEKLNTEYMDVIRGANLRYLI